MPRSSASAHMEIDYPAVCRCLEHPPENLWVAEGELAPVMRASIPMGIELHHEVDISMGSFYELTEPIKTCGRDVLIEAHGHDRLFPRFTGSLEAYPTARGTQLELAGSYEIPTGPTGSLIDTVVLGRLAAASLHDLFAVVVQHVAEGSIATPPAET